MGPISGIGCLGSSDEPPCDGGDEWLCRGMQCDLRDGLAKRLNDGIDHCRVEGVRSVQMVADDALRLELLLECSDLSFRPGDDAKSGALLDAIWSVAGRSLSIDSVLLLTAIMEPRGRSCINRPRRATMRRASSSSHTPASVAATNSPMLCPASSQFDAQALPESRQRVLDDEDRRLRVERVHQRDLSGDFISSSWIKQLTQIQVKVRFEIVAAIVHDSPEERFVAIEVQAHVDVLRALASKKKDDGRIPAIATFTAAVQGIRLRQQFGGFARIGGNNEPPVRRLFASDLKRVGGVANRLATRFEDALEARCRKH